MEKIVENTLNSILERLERLEKLEKEKESKPVWKTNPNKPATPRQLEAIVNMGGEIWDNMTQADIEEQFKILREKRNRPEKEENITKKVQFSPEEQKEMEDAFI